MNIVSKIMCKYNKNQTIAIRDGHSICFEEFASHVMATMEKISAQQLILHEKSSYRFLVGLMAALYAGIEVIIPPNDLRQTFKLIAKDRLLIVESTPVNKFLFSELNPNRTVLYFYTSGSTGQMKAVQKTLQQIDAEIIGLHKIWGDGLDPSIILATVSHQHIYGMLFKVMWPFCAGWKFDDTNFIYWEALFAAMLDDCMIVSSPAHLGRFPMQMPTKKAGAIFTSGGHLPFGAAGKTKKTFGCLPIEIFGSTETGGIGYRQQISQNVPWQPFDGIRILSDKQGILSIKSPYLAQSGWYATSDMVSINDDESFLLKGRADRVVKIEGKRVSLEEIEKGLMRHQCVVDVCCFITNDQRKSLVAVVVLSDEGKEVLKDSGSFRMGRLLRHSLADILEPIGHPRRWRFIDKIPVNAQGKRLIAELDMLY